MQGYAAKQTTDMEQKKSVPVYLSPRDLAARWRCSRSTVARIAKREGLTRLCLGEGRSVVRFAAFPDASHFTHSPFVELELCVAGPPSMRLKPEADFNFISNK